LIFLTAIFFGANGPRAELDSYVSDPAHTVSVSKPSSFLTPGYGGRIFSRSMKEAKNMPIQSSPATVTPNNLVLDSLRMFDYTSNNSVPTALPQCTFAPDIVGESLIVGAKHLDKYGPLHFKIMYTIAVGLGGEFLKVCKVKTPAQVNDMLETVFRCAGFCSGCTCLSFSAFLYIFGEL
jgi:hypothetical protein